MEERERRNIPDDRYHRYDRIRASCMENSMRWRNIPKADHRHGARVLHLRRLDICGGDGLDLCRRGCPVPAFPHPVFYRALGYRLPPRQGNPLRTPLCRCWEAYRYGWVNRVLSKPGNAGERDVGLRRPVATNWLRDPMRIRTVKFSVNHMMDQMDFPRKSMVPTRATSSARGCVTRQAGVMIKAASPM